MRRRRPLTTAFVAQRDIAKWVDEQTRTWGSNRTAGVRFYDAVVHLHQTGADERLVDALMAQIGEQVCGRTLWDMEDFLEDTRFLYVYRTFPLTRPPLLTCPAQGPVGDAAEEICQFAEIVFGAPSKNQRRPRREEDSGIVGGGPCVHQVSQQRRLEIRAALAMA